MLTQFYLFGWSYDQWRAAAAEMGESLGARDIHRAFIEEGKALERLSEMQDRWHDRHVFEPLQSPIVIADTYRARPAC